MTEEAREAAAIKGPLKDLLAEAREFLDPLVGYSWSSEWDEKQAAPLMRRLADAIAAFDQDVTRWDEYRKAWHKAEEERDAAHAAGVAEGIRRASAIAREYAEKAGEQSNREKAASDYRMSDMSFGKACGADAVADHLDTLT